MSTGKSRKDSAADVTPQLGKTIQRLRQAYNLSLGDLSDRSGVAKSIISQIEKNETNPTLATIWRLSQALDTSIDEVLRSETRSPLVEHLKPSQVPLLTSQDGLCRLRIIGWLNTVEWVQWYDFEAEPGGVLESEPHQSGSVENLSVLQGILQVEVGDETFVAETGDTLRYRGDLEHKITNVGAVVAKATMVNILKTTVME